MEEMPDTAADADIIDVPDIPAPSAGGGQSDVIDDEFDGAFKFSIIGAGQAGGRICESFYRLGYRRVCAVNTALQDLGKLNLPEDRKLSISTGGAGKDPHIARAAIEDRNNYENVYDFMRRSFGVGYDRILIALGAGGGTGAGTAEALVDIAHDVLRSLKIETDTARVGMIVALPKNSEGRKPCANAYRLMHSLFKMAGAGSDDPPRVSPLIVIDNERIKHIYPLLPVSRFWGIANQSIAKLFHLFNTVAIRESSLTSFDQSDLETVLDSGVVVFGATPVEKCDGPTDISHAIRDNLMKNILAGGMDPANADVAGCIFIGDSGLLGSLPEEYLDHGFEMLSRIMSKDSTVHRGIYRGSKKGLVVYTILGGLSAPAERMDEIQSIGLLKDWDGGV